MKFSCCKQINLQPIPELECRHRTYLSSSEAYIYFDSDESDTAKESLTAKIIEIFDLTNPPEEYVSNETQTVEDSAFFGSKSCV